MELKLNSNVTEIQLKKFNFFKFNDTYYHLKSDVPFFSCLSYDCKILKDGTIIDYGNSILIYDLTNAGFVKKVQEITTTMEVLP